MNKNKIRLIATTTFGLEAIAKREIQNLGYEIDKVEDGKVTFIGDIGAIARSNLWLRTADRILLRIDEFEAKDFETLFQRVKGWPWEELISFHGKFIVTCSTVKSQLSSEPACQSVVKKAIADRLCDFYGQETMPETGEIYKIKVSLLKDRATITVDTSGEGLHKRGYRKSFVAAPMKETMASALIQLSFWKDDRILVDPFCGSGTLAIEAAMIGLNIAPGLNRNFESEKWEFISQRLWKEARKEAYSKIDYNKELLIYAMDIDKEATKATIINCEAAGVDHVVNVMNQPFKSLKPMGDRGIIVTNPPYGERIGTNKELSKIYEEISSFMKENEDWSLFAITSDESFEDKAMGRKADRRRKLFNGRIKTCFYQFHGINKCKDCQIKTMR